MRKVYLDEIEEKSEELVSYSKNDVATEIAELKDLSKKLIWEGAAKDKYVSGYNKRIEKLNDLNNNVCKIAEFLLKVKDDYYGTNEKINQAYEELINEIKIKGVDEYEM